MEARNGAQKFDVEVGESGLRVTSYSQAAPNWRWEIGFRGVGLNGNFTSAGINEISAENNRVELHREGVTEWYENGPHGLEQGFTVFPPPAGLKSMNPALVGDRLRLEMSLTTDLNPLFLPGRECLAFLNRNGRVQLNFAELHAFDAAGRDVPARFDLIKKSGADSRNVEFAPFHDNPFAGRDYLLAIDLAIDSAVFPITVDPILENPGTKNDLFGYSVAMLGNTLVVGAPMDDAIPQVTQENSGAVFIFIRNPVENNQWDFLKKLTASDAEPSDGFGVSVAITGNNIVVGSDNGKVHIFHRPNENSASWEEVAKLHELIEGDPGTLNLQLDGFGISLAADDNTVAVGANSDNDLFNDSGAVYIFEGPGKDSGPQIWRLVKKLKAGELLPTSFFGQSLALDGDRIAIGSQRGDEGEQAGSVYIFERDFGGEENWGEAQKINPRPENAKDLFGNALALTADELFIGAPDHIANEIRAGAVFVFEPDPSNDHLWSEAATLVPETPTDLNHGLEQFGRAITVQNDRLLIGAPGIGSSGGELSTANLRMFNRNGDGLWEEAFKLDGGVQPLEDRFGASISISGDFFAVGTENPGGPSGSADLAFVFRITMVQWDNPADIEVDTPLGPEQYNPIVDALGSFTFDPPQGTLLPVGPNQPLKLSFSPFDTESFTPAEATVFINVVKKEQNITFEPIPEKIATDSPFLLHASATSGLPITFSVVFGPAAIAGNRITLSGSPGEILIRADQPGNEKYISATAFTLLSVVQAFDPFEGLGNPVQDLADWFFSPWFGFYNTTFEPWIFHPHHGFLFVSPESSPDSIFIFDLSIDNWIFTNSELYPNLFIFGGLGWVFYFDEPAEVRTFFQYSTGEFLFFPPSG